VNYEHLLIGTDLENNRDRWERGRSNIGSLHGMARLTEESVKEARKLRREGVPLKQIAIKLNVKYQTVVSATNGSRWKHVEDI
jgi:DNA invertase Pin-like site-specific DNA recombinase